MDFNELYEKYQILLLENEKLKIENDDLKKRFGYLISNLDNKAEEQEIPIEEKEEVLEEQELSEINNLSSPEDKIKLFMSLFRGREDVYSKRWQNKVGKAGYSPVCINEWLKGICSKPKIKCTECNYKRYVILDIKAIEKHLKGTEVLGIYPMLTDETCNFLAIDFDDDGYEKDVSIIVETCIEKNIPFSVERSRSGNGAHIWFFFNEKINASLARKFGTAILTYSMMKRHELKFESYDRLFPNQDTMPKGGLGNLIALPLQQNARKNNNSVFINDNFQPYEDQWSYLSCVRKLSLDEVSEYVSELCIVGNELGDLRKIEDEETKPWETTKTTIKLSKEDFPSTVNIIKANMIYISKNGFSNKALNSIKRIAAFKNPDFYKAQAMRLPTYKKPRIISLSEEDSNYLFLPRGCEEELKDLLSEKNVETQWKDERYSGRKIDVEFNGELREEQVVALNNLTKYSNGVLAATTAFGKTVIGAKLISEKKVNTLVLVHTQQLLEQWKQRLNQFLLINEILPVEEPKKRGRKKVRSLIGQIGAGKNNLSGIIDIGIMQSLITEGEVKELIKDYGMVIVDECHHVPAFSFEQILKSVGAKYVYGLTATPYRQDGHHPIIFMQCGPIRYKVDAKMQAEKRPFEHYIIPKFTQFKKPVSQNEKEWTIGEIYSEISKSQIRNQLILDDVINCVKEGRNPIILSERTSQVEVLAKYLKERLPNVITLTGAMPPKAIKAEIESLSKISKESSVVIVATGKFVGEGFDEPRLDTLFLAMPIAWKGTVQQYAGRLHRLYENKNEVQIYDYVDVHVGVLERMYHKRLKGYASMGYSAKTDSKPFEEINSIFNNNNFLTIFSNDIFAAKGEIVIVSPFISKRRLSQMMTLLMNGIKNGAKVKVITRPETDFKEKDKAMLQEMHQTIKATGIEVIFKENIHQKFAIIDQKVVWYGSINLLSFGTSEESIMRLDSINIANELICSL